MKIWVDADATPRPVKDMLFRAAERTGVEVVFVANQPIRMPTRGNVRLVVVGQGFDVADDYIEEQVEKGDLLITQDIPLAAAAVEKGAIVIENRGEVIDARNAASKLQMRDFMETMRLSNPEAMAGGPKPFNDRDKRRFAGQLDRWLARWRQQAPKEG